MRSAAVHLTPKTHQALNDIAFAAGESVEKVLERAVEDLYKRVYLDGLNADYARLRKNSRAWAQFQRELREWELTNSDGLDEI